MERKMNYTEKALEFLKNILRIDSTEGEYSEGAPFGKGVRECLDLSLAEMSKYGLDVKNGDGYYGYGEIGTGDLFGVLAHLDVVPKGDGWTYDPFGAVEKDGKIFARGALDDKGPFVASFFAFAELLAEGLVPKKKVRFILGCDEESGWKCMDRYCEREEMPKMGFSPDGDFPVINCEKGIVYHTLKMPLPDGMIAFRGGERANMVPNYAEAIFVANGKVMDYLDSNGIEYRRAGKRLVVSAEGVSCHGSHPEAGVNAIIKLLEKIHTYDYRLTAIYHAFCLSDGSNVKLDLKDKESGALTLNLGCVKSENKEITMELDIRHPISYNKDKITKILTKELPDIEVEQGFYHLPLYVAKDNELVESLLSAYNEVTGEKAGPVCIGGGTYARVLPLGVAFGPCFPGGNGGMHCADEYIGIEDFKKMKEIYKVAFKKLCF